MVSAAGERLSALHRRRQIGLRAATIRDLLRLWRVVDPTNLKETIPPFVEAAALLTGERFRLSAETAADYYRTLRDTEGAGGISTVSTLPLPEGAPFDKTLGTLRGAALSGIVNARRGGKSLEAATANGFVKVSGTASNLVLAGGRQQIANATRDDPAATGRWRRITSGNPCPFCSMIAGRGAIFSEDTGGFRAHDHCSCMAEPEFA